MSSLFGKIFSSFKELSSFLKVKASFEWPSFSQWRRIPEVLTKKEKIALTIFFILFLGSLIFLSWQFYLKNTEIIPAVGGSYQEGVVGSPRFINPIYAISDVDRDLVELLFSGLMKYDENSKIIPDLAQKYEIQEEGKVYQIYLKENIFWHDGQKLTADDIIFTIKTIQNPDYKSPLRANWLGVEVEKIDELSLRFRLKNPYYPFLERLTQKILPKHIWQDISSENFPLAIYNLQQPIGSGPYQFKKLNQDKFGKIISLDLVSFEKYFDKKPFLPLLSFRFFEREEDLINSAEKKEIKGFSLINPKNYDLINSQEFTQYSLSLPRYFALFFNPQKSKVLAEKEVREALNYGTNKKEVLEKVILNQGQIVDSPLLPDFYGFSQPSRIYQFDIEKAKEILEKAGFKEGEDNYRVKAIKKEPSFQLKSDLKLGSQGPEVEALQKCLAKDSEIYPQGQITGYFGQKTKEAVIRFQEKYSKEILEPWGFKEGTGLVSKTTRAKLNEVCFSPTIETLPLSFSLITVDQPQLIKVANLLKEQWQKLGVKIEVQTKDISTLEREVIKTRDYEALLFGQALGSLPDPFPFWHSSQVKDPGLNLSKFEDKKVDKLLEEARITLDSEKRAQQYQELQDLLIQEGPAIFLYSPDFIYFVSKEIKGIKGKTIVDHSKRFNNITEWYLQTKRVWK